MTENEAKICDIDDRRFNYQVQKLSGVLIKRNEGVSLFTTANFRAAICVIIAGSRYHYTK